MEYGMPPDEKRRFTLHCAALHLTVEFALLPGEYARLGSSPEAEISLPMPGIAEEHSRFWCDEEGALWMSLPDGTPVRNPSHLSAGRWHFVITPVPTTETAPAQVPRAEAGVPPPIPRAPSYPDISAAPPMGSTARRRYSLPVIGGAAAAIVAVAALTLWLIFREHGELPRADDMAENIAPSHTPATGPPATHQNEPAELPTPRPGGARRAVKEEAEALARTDGGALEFDSEKLEKELRDTVLFCRRMENTLASLPAAFPALSAKIEHTQKEWNQSLFREAAKAGEKMLTRQRHALFLPEGMQQFDKITEAEKLPSPYAAVRFLEQMRYCGVGEFPQRIMRGHLLRVYPEYAEHPEMELQAGWAYKEKNTSLKRTDVHMLIPMSWRGRPVGPEYPMARYDLQYGNGPAACMVLIMDLKTAPGSPIDAEDWAVKCTQQSIQKELAGNNTAVTAFEQTRCNGHRAVRFLSRQTMKSDGRTVYRGSHVTNIASDSGLVEINLNTDSWESSAAVDSDLAKLTPLLELIANSVEFTKAER